MEEAPPKSKKDLKSEETVIAEIINDHLSN